MTAVGRKGPRLTKTRRTPVIKGAGMSQLQSDIWWFVLFAVGCSHCAAGAQYGYEWRWCDHGRKPCSSTCVTCHTHLYSEGMRKALVRTTSSRLFRFHGTCVGRK